MYYKCVNTDLAGSIKLQRKGRNTQVDKKLPASTLEENLKKALTELLILFLLSEQDHYIGELTALLSQRSGDTLNIVFPYAAVYRLQEDGYILELGRRIAPDGRRRQYYGITETGKLYLAQMLETYSRFLKGVNSMLKLGGERE